ncbi:MAG: DUF4388 domain-containing protein [Deltaproteobacteria bacterium]|nr:DUF4388 domain-containing protein [Deltaproteobacteria bacterium]MBN2673598.1 DUF4388 domain-containing protein [Deltaproteobacteria bacterium]
MALTGTLSDLGVIDLVTFPTTAKKTGELIVAGLEDEARVYYNDGVIEHIACGERLGVDGLAALISWIEGEFEFRQGVTTDRKTVSLPLDELLAEAEQQRRTASRQSPESAGKNKEVLMYRGTIEIQKAIAVVASNLEYVEHVALYQRDGALICHWDREAFDDVLHDLVSEVLDVFNIHPRAGLQKVYLTDTRGTSIATLVTDDLILLLMANDLSSIGMVSVASSKIVQAVLDLGSRG